MMTALIVAAAMLAQASPAPPAPTAQPAPAAEAKPVKPAKPKLICVDEAPIDSIISRRTCRTREQVEADRLKAKENADWVGDRTAFCKGRPGC
jgi:predicted secreted protein